MVTVTVLNKTTSYLLNFEPLKKSRVYKNILISQTRQFHYYKPLNYMRVRVRKAVNITTAVFWDVTSCY